MLKWRLPRLQARACSHFLIVSKQVRVPTWCRCISVAAATPRASGSVVLANEPVFQLRDYQEECIQSVLSHLDQGRKRLGVSLATGSGKTVIFTQLIDRLKPPRQNATQALIIAHRRELVEQAARHCTNAYPSKSVDIEMGNQYATGTADITVASIQSICSKDRIEKFDPQRFKLVLVDEAHHIVAPGYMETLKYFGLLNPSEDSPALVGVSATLSRFDGLKLGAAIDHIVYHKDYIDMIEEKWLANVVFTTVQSKADISRVKSGANGDFQAGELSRAINTDKTNEIAVRAWFSRATERKSTIAFCADIAHVVGLTNMFRKHGVDARFVTGDTLKQTRSETLDAFKSREFPVLVNCGVFTEGTDIPNIDCVLLARPTKSRNLLVQMIGRGMRLHPGKESCHVIDMVASLESGIVTTPTLLGLDPSEILENVDIKQVKDIQSRKQAKKEKHDQAMEPTARHASNSADPGTITFTDYDSVLDLVRDSSGERYIRQISQHAWVQARPERYILQTNRPSYLAIEKLDHARFVVREVLSIPKGIQIKSKSPFLRPREVAEAQTFEDIVHAADTYAAKKCPKIWIATNEAWRKKPASQEQLDFLNSLRPHDKKLNPDTLTKGTATDMIIKLKHGARGQFDKLATVKRKTVRDNLRAERLEEMQSREVVKVGPLQG